MTRAELEAEFGELGIDHPLPGLSVLQPRKGYRFGVEVYLLTSFALGRELNPPPFSPPRSVIELGSGGGVVSLLMAAAGAEVWGVERDPAWVDLARESLSLCDPAIAERVHFVEGDVRDLLRGRPVPGLPARADLVLTNPPWFDPATGPASPNAKKAVARTMLTGTVAEFFRAGQILSPRVCLITIQKRLDELRAAGVEFSRHAPIGKRVSLAEWVQPRSPPS